MRKNIGFLITVFFSCLLFATAVHGEDFFWERSVNVSAYGGKFPVSDFNDTVSVVVWQERVSDNAVMLSSAVWDTAVSAWAIRRSFAGPLSYAGTMEPSLASVVVSPDGKIIVAALEDSRHIALYESVDKGKTYVKRQVQNEGSGMVAPRISVSASGGYLLFATRGENETLTPYLSRSSDGESWSDFAPFIPDMQMRLSFLPVHGVVKKRDVVVFQSLYMSRRSSFQLYASYSDDHGRSWSDPQMITSFNEPGLSGDTATFPNFDNQRPNLCSDNGKLMLVWERGRLNAATAIYAVELSAEGLVTGKPERVSTGSSACSDPVIFSYKGDYAVTWMDNRSTGSAAYFAFRDGQFWDAEMLSAAGRNVMFVRPVITDGDLHVFCQAGGTGTDSVVRRLSPDRAALKPSFTAENYKPGVGIALSNPRTAIHMPDDSSGVAGYSWIVTKDPTAEPPKLIMEYPDGRVLRNAVNDDGDWYIAARVQDYAGNWSDTARITFTRDTTGPNKPVIVPPFVDDNGFAITNNPELTWISSGDPDIAGYTYSFEYLDDLSRLTTLMNGTTVGRHTVSRGTVPNPVDFDAYAAVAKAFKPETPPARIMTSGTATSYYNCDDGIYAFSVAAIDNAGNIGETETAFLYFNKYKPVTYITYVTAKQERNGILNLSVVGRGFARDGLVNAVYLYKNGAVAYTLQPGIGENEFTVVNDRLISNIKLPNIKEGSYRLMVEHPVRGKYLCNVPFSVVDTGTVKFGDFSYTYTPSWKTAAGDIYRIDIPQLVLRCVLLLLVLSLLFFSFRLAATAGESKQIRLEVAALLSGDLMPAVKKEHLKKLQTKGISLRTKLVGFTTALVLTVVVVVSILLGQNMLKIQEQTLAGSLESRTKVLLESLTTSARAYLPSNNVLELGFLPDQTSALDEAEYATITGCPADNKNTSIDFVWATNDSTIENDASYTPGAWLLEDSVSETIKTMQQELNDAARKSVSELSKGITELTAEGIKLALNTDAVSVERRNEIQSTTRQLEEKLNSELTRLSAEGSGSYPAYNNAVFDRTNTEYIFFKPVLYRQGSDDTYVRGVVRIKISTKDMIAVLDTTIRNLVMQTITFAVAAVLLGLFGALFLAYYIVAPIRRLARHVEMIRDTEDKEDLEGKNIEISSKDEIGLLGDTVNDMTHGLVKAAAASKDLTVGKEIQKMFIPLHTDRAGRKLSTGSRIEDTVRFFGYYEGAKGVSGDYFDYQKLDDRYYAIIKCDVAGKGVPAALIMVEVATLFLNYFKDWTLKKNGTHIEKIVAQINDLLESRGFKGRFAAFTLCLFDSVSGDAYFCNAGDNLVHIYDATIQKMKHLTLPEIPAAGIFDSSMIDMKGGYQVIKCRLNPGDILFMYTDGIEEAKRMFRNEKFEIITCEEDVPEVNNERLHATHLVGQDNEELGAERVAAIIEAVMSKSVYRLEKYHSSAPGELLEFDFSSCDGLVDEVIMALVSVEKVFRMYRDPTATDFDRVQVDRKVDEFLAVHFNQYSDFCSFKRDHATLDEYMYYTTLKEDSQYDDLTILGIQKK